MRVIFRSEYLSSIVIVCDSVPWRIKGLPLYPRRVIKRMVRNGTRVHAGTRWFINIDYNVRLVVVIDRYTGRRWYLLI